MSTKSLTTSEFSLVEDDWIAECLSLQPERSIRISYNRTSWDALVVLYILSHLESSYWLTDEYHRKLANDAYRNNYEGEWRNVQDCLEHYCQTPKEFYDWFVKYHHPEEFFGNIVRKAQRRTRYIDFKLRDPHGRVQRPERHRGYRDKGTLRPPHRPPVEPPVVEKEDRRQKVGHPLLSEPG